MNKALFDDPDIFISRKEYYKRVGKAWKSGLYGPPGTGKLSLIAAMADYPKFDVYDLDLKEVQSNSAFSKLLIGTSSRSILVFEDAVTSFESKAYNRVSFSSLIEFLLCSFLLIRTMPIITGYTACFTKLC